MAELNKLVLPVKNESTGEITNQEFDLPSGGGGGSSKADKVIGATSGNFAGLDANGNLTDSGSKPSDFLTSHQDISGKMDKNNPTGTGSFSLNRKANTTVGTYSVAEGNTNTASGVSSHAEGQSTTASGGYSHAEGGSTTASGNYAHAGGYRGEAKRAYSFVHGGSTKFSGILSYGQGATFGFAPDGTNYASDTTITNGYDGCSGVITGTATVTIALGYGGIGGMYLLLCCSYTTSTGAIYGATTRMIVGHGTNSGTPTNLSLGQTSNAPATIAMASNNTITIKNAATSRATAFHLIKIY